VATEGHWRGLRAKAKDVDVEEREKREERPLRAAGEEGGKREGRPYISAPLVLTQDRPACTPRETQDLRG
jgi:hypothetical protein